ncbi:hypothetical protein MPSEU_000612800 [Mayamaea pseudoterrestris]|nr:hypothetical protein MPSEU_000612800 [Mayamaea pseudoterrestris]
MSDTPAPPRSPTLYMTPQLQKRKDGLFPSFCDFSRGNSSKGIKKNPGGINKPYRTNLDLLLQIKGESPELKEELALTKLVESIQDAIDEIVGPDQDVVSKDFNAAGCEWRLEFNPALNDADKNYALEVILFCNKLEGVTNFVCDCLLVPKGPVDPNPLAAPLKGYREGKQTFELLSLIVRKAIVKFEFPDFPEGCQGRPFREVYQLNARLKSGSFATVCRGTHRATGRKVAIKCVLRKDLPPADDAAIYDEVAILSSLTHPHIVPIIDFFDEKDCYFIIMELMSGGDLFDRIGKKKSYSEADARDLIVKMLKAVAYCHARKIAHCDMKPKNLLLMSDDNDSFIKLADFGFAARVHEPNSLSKQCGTPFFVSPEILMRKGYDQQSDMWSVGCIVYLLLSGNLPFMGRSQKELFRKIVAGKFDFDDDEWNEISDEAKDLVTQLLVLDPSKRITAADAVRHEWLKASRDRLGSIMLQGTSQRLKTFNARMKLRSAMIAIDWVSSLRKMTTFSQRNLNNTSVESAASSGTAPLLETTRKVEEERQKELDRQKRLAATANQKAAQAKKAMSGATKDLKKMSLAENGNDDGRRGGHKTEI